MTMHMPRRAFQDTPLRAPTLARADARAATQPPRPSPRPAPRRRIVRRQLAHRRAGRARAAHLAAPAPAEAPQHLAGTARHLAGTARHLAGTARHLAGTARHLAGALPALSALASAPHVPPPSAVPALRDTSASPAGAEHHRIASSAAVIMLGGLLSSFLGMLRLETLNTFFYGLASGAFTFGLRPIILATDSLIAGLTSGALIPTFVDYAAPERREELRRVYSTVANLVAIVMAIACAGLALAAPYFLPLELREVSPAGQRLAVSVVRIAALGLLGLGLYAVGSALLFALKEVRAPAFATGIQHVGVVVCGLLALLFALRRAGLPLADVLHAGAGGPALDAARAAGAHGLAAGFAVGAAGEFLLLVPSLRRLAVHWRPVLDLRHPAVRQILRLYAPIAVGLAVSVAAQNLEVALLGLTPGDPLKNATSYWSAITLIQFPVGLVSAALSLAVLPPLAAAASAGDHAAFRRTVIFGFRLALFLLVPAMVGLLMLGQPIMAVLFQHGACAADCTARNVLALRNLAYQLPFLALDQILIAAFYARKNTLTPMFVGIASVACYLVVAAPFARTIGLPAIALANTAQNAAHAVILLVLLTYLTGGLGLRSLAGGCARIALAAIGMALACLAPLALLPRLAPHIFAGGHLLGALATVAIVGTSGTITYFALARALGLEEPRLLAEIARARLGSRPASAAGRPRARRSAGA